METTHELPTPRLGATPTDAPILPPAAARPAPSFERREVHIDRELIGRPPAPRTSLRAYVIGAVGLAVVSVGGWFALSEYIYG